MKKRKMKYCLRYRNANMSVSKWKQMALLGNFSFCLHVQVKRRGQILRIGIIWWYVNKSNIQNDSYTLLKVWISKSKFCLKSSQEKYSSILKSACFRPVVPSTFLLARWVLLTWKSNVSYTFEFVKLNFFFIQSSFR